MNFKKKLNKNIYIGIAIFVIFSSAIFVLNMLNENKDDNIYIFSKNWRYIIDDEILEYKNLPINSDFKKTIILKNTIPQNIKGSYLYMYYYNYYYDIYIDDEKIFSNSINAKNIKSFNSVGHGFDEIPLDDSYFGKTIEIKINFPNVYHSGKIYAPYIATGIDFSNYLFKNSYVSIIGTSFIMLIGILLLILFLVINKKNKDKSKINIKFLINLSFILIYSALLFICENKFIIFSFIHTKNLLIILYFLMPLMISLTYSFFKNSLNKNIISLKILTIICTIYIIIRFILDINYILYFFDFKFIYYYFYIATISITILNVIIENTKIRHNQGNNYIRETIMLLTIIFDIILDGFLITTKNSTYSNEFAVITLTISSLFLYIHAIVIINNNISEQEYLQYYKDLATIDTMTNLYNKSSFMNDISMYNLNIIESTVKPIIIIFDIDNMKKINDFYGHKSGDDAIITTAQLLKKIFINSKIYRLGGDEFACLYPYAKINDEQNIIEYIKDFQNEILNISKQKSYDFNVSFGYAIFNYTDNNLNSTLNRADMNMYKNKNYNMSS